MIADARFLFDRIVPLSRQELFRVAQEQETIAYARTEEGPFAAIYLSVPNRSEDELARYLPEGVGSADVACPAEAGDYERVDASGSLYAFAGIETDLTADSLQQVGDSNGEPVYADPDSAQPFPELFFSSGGGLLRFVVVGDDGRPASIAESLAFNGTEFAFESDATDAVDPASLTKVGCSTAFPVFAPTDTVGGGFTQLYVLAGTRLLSFTGAGAAPAEETTPPTTTTTSTTTTTTTTQPPTTTTTTTADHDHDDRPRQREPPTTNRRRRSRRRPNRRRRNRRRRPRRRRPPTTTDVHDDNGAADDHVDVDDDDRTANDDLDVHHHHGGADDDDDRTATTTSTSTTDDHHDHRRRTTTTTTSEPPEVDHDDRRDPGDDVQRQPGRAHRAGDPGAPAEPDPVRWRRLCLCPG